MIQLKLLLTKQESNLFILTFSKFQYIEKKSGDKVDTVK